MSMLIVSLRFTPGMKEHFRELASECAPRWNRLLDAMPGKTGYHVTTLFDALLFVKIEKLDTDAFKVSFAAPVEVDALVNNLGSDMAENKVREWRRFDFGGGYFVRGYTKSRPDRWTVSVTNGERYDNPAVTVLFED